MNRIVSFAESEGSALSRPVVVTHNQQIRLPATVAALPTIIRYFESHGYVTPTELEADCYRQRAPAFAAVSQTSGQS